MKIWRKIIHSHLGKGMALLLTGSLLTDIMMPTVSLALTGGPSQPEFEGFTELGVTNMVDPFTGDFSYEIPLMTVPGPNGGYPINLNYAAGAGMEDEASWVGLGWTLNPGAINRNMRGVPDDFSGPQQDLNDHTLVPGNQSDLITKSTFTKDNITVALGLGITLPPQIEAATVELPPLNATPSASLYYNNYKGVGFRTGIGLKLNGVINEATTASAGFNLNFDSNDGADLQPSISMGHTKNKNTTSMAFGFGYNSRQGVTGHFLKSSRHNSQREGKLNEKNQKEKGSSNNTKGAGASFSTASGVPSTPMAMSGFNTGFSLDFEAGVANTDMNIPVNINGMLTVQKVKDDVANGQDYQTYGTLYSGYRQDPKTLMDYNREKEAPLNTKLPMLPLPVMTQDVYSVTGAGVGGSFRAFRNDVGIFSAPSTTSNFMGLTIGVETATSTGFKVGVDPTVNISHSYSGKWRNDDSQMLQTNYFRKQDHMTRQNGILKTVQPFDFRFIGENTANTPGDNRFAALGGTGAAHYLLFPATGDLPDVAASEYDEPSPAQMPNWLPFDRFTKFQARASNKLNGQPILSSQTERTQKERKVQLVEYRTRAEILAAGQPYLPSVFVTDPSQIMPSKTAFSLTQGEIKGHHIAEFSIVQSGGIRYVYGLPLYNRVHEEYYFAIKKPSSAGKTVTVSGINSVLTGKKGLNGDKYYSSTKISPYAHSHLLTHIVSPDYVDVDNNGPSENDYGYWTKFNYQEIQTYKWRVPLGNDQANYIEGFASNPNDDKATVTYGERDITYLHSVETKTHVAVFFVKDRTDARGVTGAAGSIAPPGSAKCLDRIVLYAKNDLNKPLKAVHFEYDYSLCDNVDNGDNGKLTLKKIWFVYGDSPKGALTPYTFGYGQVYKDQSGTVEMAPSTVDGNPAYAMLDVDRWGAYKEPQGGVSNLDNPYVEQGEDGADRRLQSATAWNLTDITLPTGAAIKISYEMDDYAYVQDKASTQMYRIAGMGKTDGSADEWLVSDKAQITNDYRRVYFYLDNQTATSSDVKRMLDEIPDGKIYFKTWQRLQVPKGKGQQDWAYDYVTGYAPILKTSGSYGTRVDPNGKLCGYFELANDNSGPNNAKNFFRKAGLQYLRYQRADLDLPQSQGAAALQAVYMILSGVPILMDNLQMIMGYYNWAIVKGNCKFIDGDKPSFVKLGSADGIKYGGGHRVRKITVSDIWEDLSNGTSATYGIEYRYQTEDDNGRRISSGVASYEPIIGGEENPLKKSHYYNVDNKYIHDDPAFFLEEPFGESYFPAPMVGYSKVTVVNLANRLNVKSGDGIRVNEFYTAKDFPVKAQFTPQPQRIQDKQTVFVPIIATIQFTGYGYSQGYYVELNDMHGKAKAETMYDADYWDVNTNYWNIPDPPFVSKRIYRYKSSGKNLVNTVDVLDADQQVRTALMGESSEMFSEMNEDYGYTISVGAQINGGVDPTPLGIFVSAFPSVEYSETAARTLVTTKVVYKNGILDEVVDMAEGSVKKTKNLLFDPETGGVLLTAVTSDFDNPQAAANDQYIYNYTYPAHWYYGGMQAAYRNYRNMYTFSGSSVFPDADRYFEKGDELLSAAGARVWVKNVTSGAVTLMNAAGTNVTPNGTYVTMRSGKRNQQNVPTGTLTSLQSPVGAYRNAFLDFYNANVFNNPAYASVPASGQYHTIPFNMTDCAEPDLAYNGKLYVGNYAHPSNSMVIFAADNVINIGSDNCKENITFQIPAEILALGFVPSKARFDYYDRDRVLLTYYHAPGTVYRIPVTPQIRCKKLNFCMDDVLNAAADEFSDNWQYDSEFNPPAGPLALNDYLRGNRGIWRKLRTNAYFAERKQRRTGAYPAVPYDTYIGRDGTYERFGIFDWRNGTGPAGDAAGNADNVQAPIGWRWMAEVTPTGYSPYGFETENRNALNIYSAELYGYGNSLVTASAQEAAYPEIGFDGFEEQPYTAPYSKKGHLELLTTGTAALSIETSRSHTGNQSLKVTAGSTGRVYLRVPVANAYAGFLRNGKLEMLRGRKYLVGFWYRFDGTPAGPLKVDAFDGTSNFQSASLNTASAAIEGWRRAELGVEVWQASASATVIELRIDLPAGSTLLIDDLRIHPADAAFRTFVYDPRNFLLRAILDDNNYAAFYDYDEENTLIQVKKETEEGVRTIQTTRKNAKR